MIDHTRKKKFIRIVQISDSHLFREKDRTLLGVKPNESFEAVLQLLKCDPCPPDVILHSGDMSQDESEESYQYFADLIQAFKVPVYYVPGNHDHYQTQINVFSSQTIITTKYVSLHPWQIILLNSQKPGEIPGELSQNELTHLTASLKANPGRPSLIVLHHNPVPAKKFTPHKNMLQKADAFWALLKNYANVKVVLFGHIHQDFSGEIATIKFFSCPSTWVQFKPDVREFSLDNLPQGYRWLNLFDDGTIETGIRRLHHYVGEYIENPGDY